jgi:hypothetical protein
MTGLCDHVSTYNFGLHGNMNDYQRVKDGPVTCNLS